MKRLTSQERRERKAAALQLFVKKYGRKGPGHDSNDRSYDRDVEQKVRRMQADELDALLRDGEDENSN